MKKKMLYLSHVDWNWIKQRPQFIAEGLKACFDVSVLYMFQNGRRNTLQKRSHKGEDVSPLFSIPFAGRMGGIAEKINTSFMKIQLSYHIRRTKPDYIYFTYPLQAEILPDFFNGKIIYDCMDNHTALCLEKQKGKIALLEKKLIEKADHILVSSNNLIKTLVERYGAQFALKMNLIRNGYNGEILDTTEEDPVKKATFTISYIGTVGRWFNFDFVIKSLEDMPNLRYKIIGPVDVHAPQSDQIEYTGTIEHNELFDSVKETDCLVMPFVLNEIVEAVDPVKLYEYINYNMNILCVKYDEVERFSPFVHFYTDYDSYKEQIEAMMRDNSLKYSAETRRRFLIENSWSARVDAIEKIINRQP